MKIETTTVTKIVLSELDRLDPISVILEDLGPRQGKISIECYGQAWSAYWGGMGNRTIAQFFCSCDDHYLAKNLSSIPSHITDYEGVTEKAKTEIKDQIKTALSDRRDRTLNADEARAKYDKLTDALLDAPDISDRYELEFNADLMQELFGDEWWRALPDKPNPDYEYLCRIISAVRDGLRAQLPKAA